MTPRAPRRLAAIVACAVAACGGQPKRPVAELEDPATCKECHPKHYDQWSGSMHAYASDDPVFVGMHKRGQRETAGQLGTFCVQCHAPMAVALGVVDAGNAASFDPATLPATARGVTCFFCHDVAKINDDHNNGLAVALDQTMRGGAKNPIDSPAHDAKYDPLMDANASNSEMCGSCHDVTTPRGVALERTHAEWATTFFADKADPRHHLTCNSSCHMGSSTDVIADAPGLNVGVRPFGFHEHLWPGIDQALTTFPNQDVMAAGIARDLGVAITINGPVPLSGPTNEPGGICLTPINGGQITVRVDTINLGHAWPSGSAQDRRAWLEVTAFDANGAVLFHTGDVPDGKDPEDVMTTDPNLVGFWDRTFKDDGKPAHFFWEVATVQSQLLKPPVTLDPIDPRFDHSSTSVFNVAGVAAQIARITTRVRIRPLSFGLLDDLIGSGDLDPAVRGRMKTLDVDPGTTRTWSRAAYDPASGCCMAGHKSC